MRVQFTVPGLAAPKGSRTTGQRKDGSRYTRESSKRSKPWVESVILIARTKRPGGRTLEPPYDIALSFFLPRPDGPKYDWPVRDGDLDKLARGVLDGLTQGGLIVDDRHVTRLLAEKWFADPAPVGVEIAIM